MSPRSDAATASFRRALLAACGLLVAACGGVASPVQASDRAVLEIDCPVADAVLWVDGRYMAQLRDLPGGVTLGPGHHQIEVRHDRHHAYYGEIDVRRGQRQRLSVQLAESLP